MSEFSPTTRPNFLSRHSCDTRYLFLLENMWGPETPRKSHSSHPEEPETTKQPETDGDIAKEAAKAFQNSRQGQHFTFISGGMLAQRGICAQSRIQRGADGVRGVEVPHQCRPQAQTIDSGSASSPICAPWHRVLESKRMEWSHGTWRI